jgi:hypothetical protein
VSRCVLELVVNGEPTDPDDAVEVMGMVCQYACPRGDIEADLQLDRAHTAGEVAAIIVRMLRSARGPRRAGLVHQKPLDLCSLPDLRQQISARQPTNKVHELALTSR